MDTEQTPKQKIEAACAALGLTMSAAFVPWSKSRNKDEKDDRGNPVKTLNWKVTVKRMAMFDEGHRPGSERTLLTTDYSAGIANCPAYKASVAQLGNRNSLMRDEAITQEVETGRTYVPAFSGQGSKIAPPDMADVISSLVMDASVLDAGGFEEWANEYGYDTDSRSAEATYRACLDIALKLRAGIGDDGLRALRDASQDY